MARQLIELSGKDVEIVYTGLRDGEKMHEELFGDGEADERPIHPLISHTPVPALSPACGARDSIPGRPKSRSLAALARVLPVVGPARGGQRVSHPIHLSPPDVGELEQEYVLRAMQSGWVAPAGPDLEAFEQEVADAGRRRLRRRPELAARPPCTWLWCPGAWGPGTSW